MTRRPDFRNAIGHGAITPAYSRASASFARAVLRPALLTLAATLIALAALGRIEGAFPGF